MGPEVRVRFGVFEADLRARELYKRGVRIPLQDKPFQVLAALLERPGQVVNRAELQKMLWPDVVVDVEVGLNNAVKKLRDALGDSPENPRFIETLKGRGYRFIAEVQAYERSPVVVASETGRALAQHRRRPERLELNRLARWLAIAIPVLLVGTALWVHIRQRTLVSDNTLLVFPFDIEDVESVDPDFVGRAFASALAVNLSQIHGLEVLEVPSPHSVDSFDTDAQNSFALSRGAGCVVRGSLSRSPHETRAVIQAIDPRSGRILWGTEQTSEQLNMYDLADQLAKNLAANSYLRSNALVRPEPFYDLPGNTAASEQMASSAEMTQLLLARQRHDYGEILRASEQLMRRYPEPRSLWERRLALNEAKVSQDSIRTLFAEDLAILDSSYPGHPYWEFFSQPGSADVSRQDEIAQLSQALERTDLTPSLRAELLISRADHLRALGKISESIEDLQRATILDPVNINNYQVLSGVYRADGQWDKALKMALHAYALEPSSWLAQTIVGETYRLLGRPHQALRYLQLAYETSQSKTIQQPQRVAAQYAMVLFQTGNKALADEVIQQAVGIDTKNADGQYYIACFYATTGDRERALAFLRRAIALGFQDLEITYDPVWRAMDDETSFRAIVDDVRTRVAGSKH